MIRVRRRRASTLITVSLNRGGTGERTGDANDDGSVDVTDPIEVVHN